MRALYQCVLRLYIGAIITTYTDDVAMFREHIGFGAIA
jgi:hypothetical protein